MGRGVVFVTSSRVSARRGRGEAGHAWCRGCVSIGAGSMQVRVDGERGGGRGGGGGAGSFVRLQARFHPGACRTRRFHTTSFPPARGDVPRRAPGRDHPEGRRRFSRRSAPSLRFSASRASTVDEIRSPRSMRVPSRLRADELTPDFLHLHDASHVHRRRAGALKRLDQGDEKRAVRKRVPRG